MGFCYGCSFQHYQIFEFDCMLICSSTGHGQDLPSSQDVENWFRRTYKRSPSKSVTKKSVFLNACHYFNRVANKEALRCFVFEILGRHVLNVHRDFQGVKLKKREKKPSET